MYQPTEQEIADAVAAQLAEDAEFGSDGTFLAAPFAGAALGSLTDYCASLGWDRPPVLLTVNVSYSTGPSVPIPGTDMTRTDAVTSIRPLNLPSAFWAQGGGDVVAALSTLVHQACQDSGWWDRFRQSAGLDVRRPVVMWAFVCEMGVRPPVGHVTTDPDVQAWIDGCADGTETIRGAYGVDIDGRVYTCAQAQTAPLRMATVRTPAAVAATADGSVQHIVDLPHVIELVRRLTQLTAAETAMASALDGATP